MADVALLDLEGDGPLRTHDERLAAVQKGSQAQQVLRARAPAVEREDRREGAVSGRDVRGVQQFHAREDTPGAAGGEEAIFAEP